MRMNLFFCTGRIISEINFKFILQGKRFSAAKYKMRLFDNIIIDVVAYDHTADYSYRKLEKGDFIFCEAFLSKGKVIIEYIELLKTKDEEK